MKRDALLEILSDWNLWAKEIDIGIRRDEYVKKIFNLITKTNQIVCIAGISYSIYFSNKSTVINSSWN